MLPAVMTVRLWQWLGMRTDRATDKRTKVIGVVPTLVRGVGSVLVDEVVRTCKRGSAIILCGRPSIHVRQNTE